MKIKAEVSENVNSTHSSALYDLFYFSNITVGLCTSSAAAAAYHINNKELNLACLCFIFCSTIYIYNLERLKPSQADKLNSPERFFWVYTNKSTLKNANTILLLVSFSLLISCFSIYLFLSAIILLVLSLSYNCKLKKIPAMKNLMVAGIWTFTVSIFPIIWINGNLSSFNCNYSLICFGCALINTIIFDIRDFSGDLKFGIKSIPVIFSIKLSYLLCYLIGVIISIFSVYNDMAILILIPAAYGFLVISEESKLKYLLADIVLALTLLTYL